MKLFEKKLFSILLVLLISGCANYTIPIQTENHPVSTNTPVIEIELSPLLIINQDHPCESEAHTVHSY